MLEDFIKANELQAKILPIPVKAPAIKCQLFRCGNVDVIVPPGSSNSKTEISPALKIPSCVLLAFSNNSFCQSGWSKVGISEEK